MKFEMLSHHVHVTVICSALPMYETSKSVQIFMSQTGYTCQEAQSEYIDNIWDPKENEIKMNCFILS